MITIKDIIAVPELEDLAINDYYYSCLTNLREDGKTELTKEEMITSVYEYANDINNVHDWINSYLLDTFNPLDVFNMLTPEAKELIIAMIAYDCFNQNIGVLTKENYERLKNCK